MIASVDDERAVQATRNNALWCDAVCCSHAALTLFTDAAWISFDRVSRLYPNVVTLLPDAVAAQLDSIEDLSVRLPAAGWAVKDSFQTLDLATMGFEELFEATWVHRTALVEAVWPGRRDGLTQATRVTSERDLGRWEEAWSGAPLDPHASTDRTFLPALLADEDIAFIAITNGEDLVAGLIANRAASATGISNLFVRGPNPRRLGAACVLAAADLWPELPLVSYASGPELEGLLSFGFDAVGDLRVWLRAGNGDVEVVHADS
jgi:hypothetical protein